MQQIESISSSTPLEKVRELKFSDLFLGEEASFLGGSTETGIDPVPAPDSAKEDLAKLRQACKDLDSELCNDFSICYDDITYRVSKMIARAGTVYVLRRFPDLVPSIESLGIHHGVIKKLLAKQLTGLVVIAGPTGAGKTTTASALVKQRLIEHGGVAVTAEDPPEMPLEGHHGMGYCWQTTVSRYTGGFAEASRKVMRYNPDIIFLGEIREPEAATEALRASINGHLVIATIHSDSVIKTINRLYAMADDFSGGNSASLLADGLMAVIHQRLEGSAQKSLKVEFLVLDGESSGSRKSIRDGKFEMLTSEIQAQRNRLLMEDRIGR